MDARSNHVEQELRNVAVERHQQVKKHHIRCKNSFSQLCLVTSLSHSVFKLLTQRCMFISSTPILYQVFFSFLGVRKEPSEESPVAALSGSHSLLQLCLLHNVQLVSASVGSALCARRDKKKQKQSNDNDNNSSRAMRHLEEDGWRKKSQDVLMHHTHDL